MRSVLFLVLAAAPLFADVVVLKEGGQVAGKVADKGTHWEVTTDQGLRTYLKDEVDRVITDPKEFLGDADQLFEQAKKDYEKGNAATAPNDQNAAYREGLVKLAKAREQLGNTRDLFPEDKYAHLDKQIVQVMMLMRIIRGSMHSEAAGPIVNAKPDAPPVVDRPAAVPGLTEAFAILADPAKRADANARKGARETLRTQRGGVPALYDLATAGMLVLGKSDAEWRLAGPALAAFQEYAAKPWLKEPLQVTPKAHQEAAAFLADKIAAARKADPNAGTEPLLTLAMGHLAAAPAGPDFEKTARALGFTVTNGIAGTAEGHAVRDLAGFVKAKEFELAHRAFVNDYRALDTAAVRHVWGWALFNLVADKKRGFDRPVSAMNGMKGDAAATAHAAALAKSIQAVSPCSMCAGEGWLRCTNCHGQKEIFYICKTCNGARIRKLPNGGEVFCNPCKFTGVERKLVCNKCNEGFFDCPKCKLPSCNACGSTARRPCGTCKGRRLLRGDCETCRGSGLNAGAAGGGGGGRGGLLCDTCKGSGRKVAQKCTACPNGFIDCAQCEPLRKAPEVEDICSSTPCAACEGRGLLFRRFALPCKSCLGLGEKLAPKADPSKILPD